MSPLCVFQPLLLLFFQAEKRICVGRRSGGRREINELFVEGGREGNCSRQLTDSRKKGGFFFVRNMGNRPQRHAKEEEEETLEVGLCVTW